MPIKRRTAGSKTRRRGRVTEVVTIKKYRGGSKTSNRRTRRRV